MEKAIRSIEDVKQKLSKCIQDGFDINKILDLSDMIKAVYTLEDYVTSAFAEEKMDKKSSDWFIKNIKDELAASQKYYQWWLESKNPEHRQLAQEELKHANVLLQQARQSNIPQTKFQGITVLHGDLSRKLA